MTAAFHPGQPWLDTSGRSIDAHGGGFLVENGASFFWYGSARHGEAEPQEHTHGINLYSSTDLYNWKFESRVVNATNTSGANGLTIERPKVVKCLGRYVMWVRGTGDILKVGVLTSPTPRGPWQWVIPKGAGDDPFHTLAPGLPAYPEGYQYGDATLHTVAATGKTYVYWRARLRAVGFRAMRLTDDCTGVDSSSDTRIFRSPDREAPAVFDYAGSSYLWTSGTLGWNPVQAFVYRGPTPLGPYNQSVGHGWHAYTKPPSFNSSHRPYAYTVRDGYLPVGHDAMPARQTTIDAAMGACARADACRGFTFQAHDRRPPPSTTLRVSFKARDTFVPEGDPEGLQPPPIPSPGAPGNAKAAGQPGIWSFGSQSTYILPNPLYKRGSGRPQFIYMADRWHGPPWEIAKSTYVWLPLYVDPRDPARVRVVWHDHWRLDNVSSPFVDDADPQLR